MYLCQVLPCDNHVSLVYRRASYVICVLGCSLLACPSGDPGGSSGPELERSGAIADGSGTMCSPSGETGIMDEEGCECPGGDLEGHIFRVRPNTLPLPPLVIESGGRVQLGYRLFGNTSDYRISSYTIDHHTGAQLTAEMEIIEGVGPLTSVQVTSAQPNSLSVVDSVALDLASGTNVVEWNIHYDGGEERQLLALVVVSEGVASPSIIHIGSGTGPTPGVARVYDSLIITGAGFGERQSEPGLGMGQVLVGASAGASGGVQSGTVLKWTDTRIELKIPTGSHETANDSNIFVRLPSADESAPYPFAVRPVAGEPAWTTDTCQLVGEGIFESRIRYTKDADVADFDQDGDLDIYSPVSASLPDSDEIGDIIYINQKQVENKYDWSQPLSFIESLQRVTNDTETNFCGEDEHIVTGPTNSIYESAAADIDNDGDLDIIAPRGTTNCTDDDGECDDMNWIRLSINRASASSSFEADFFFVDESESRIFDIAENSELLSPAALQDRVYDDVHVGDVDGDGDLDLLFGNRDKPTQFPDSEPHPNLILVNQGFLQGGDIGYFHAQEIGVANNVTHDARFIDYDQDGDLDVILFHECFQFQDLDCGSLEPGGVSLYRNLAIDGDVLDDTFPILFEDATDTIAGIETLTDWAVAGEIVDLDGDSWPDVVVANGSQSAQSRVLRNQSGTLVAEAFDPGISVYAVAVADVNADGYPDVITSSLLPSTWPQVFLNDGAGQLITPAVTAGQQSFWFDPDAEAKVAEAMRLPARSGVTSPRILETSMVMA